MYQAASEIQGVKLEDRQVRYGLAGEAAGSAISSLIGGFTTTAYPQNVALLKVTDEARPVPCAGDHAGVVFVVLGFIPKAGAVLSLIPSPVIGGIFLPAAASLISTGFNTLRKVESNDRSQAVIGLSLLLGIALPSALSGLEGGAHVFFSNSILVGAFCVVILKALLIDLPNLINRILHCCWMPWKANCQQSENRYCYACPVMMPNGKWHLWIWQNKIKLTESLV